MDLHNPDFVKLAEAFGARGVRLRAMDDFKPALREALEADALTIIALAVDHEQLSDRIEQLAEQINALQTTLGLPAPGVRFVDNGNGTITDRQTGLMWLKCSRMWCSFLHHTLCAS